MAELRPQRPPVSEKALFWREFFILLGVGLFGAIAVMPYAITLQGGVPAEVSIPFPLLVALGVAQNGLLLALAIGVGLLCARKVGLGAPILEAGCEERRWASEGEPFSSPLC